MNRDSAQSDARASALPPTQVLALSDTAREGLRGLRIAYREAGAAVAPPLVCLHGIGSNSTGYRHQLEALSDVFRVVAWDAPGYGQSADLPWDEPRAVDYADALAGLLDGLNLGAVSVVGSSFGAIIAASFAARHPERVHSIVLSAPATGFARLPKDQRDSLLHKRVDDMERLGPAELARQRAPQLVADDASPAVVEAAIALVAAIRPRGYTQAARTLDTADTAADAGKIMAPTLVLVGSEDRITPAETCARPVHAALPNGRLEVLEGIGHLLKLEAPERFNRLVADFILKSRPG